MLPLLLTITARTPRTAQLSPADTQYTRRSDIFIEIDQSFRAFKSDCRRTCNLAITSAGVSVDGASEWVYYLYFETEDDGMQQEEINQEKWEEFRGVLLDQANGVRTKARVEVQFSVPLPAPRL
jgi:hypothetical protein